MPKKLKLDLDNLKIQSFITTLNENERKNFKGGSGDCDTPGTNCNTVCNCPTHYATCSCQPLICGD